MGGHRVRRREVAKPQRRKPASVGDPPGPAPAPPTVHDVAGLLVNDLPGLHAMPDALVDGPASRHAMLDARLRDLRPRSFMPSALDRCTGAFACEPDAWVDGSRALVDGSRALVERPDALVERPGALVERPDALAERPDALAERPDALAERPDALAERPDALAERPDACADGSSGNTLDRKHG